ncbi:LysR family transcriptional regulator [Lentzea sp. BCCO 10_0856]|uniref:LysR family transcriptional regulator n=1 Tax=Lentzea miocenica TaxID=3095431 RepID=A0ABU4TEX8_9PSEU|nr:LysR family transcriptional regulator [Lentzea sp. BCCO 10_0856]MDX8036443.1 LysR family transcriptional regulator [Lentzea sp. BCCO 10_0856]
MELQQMRYVVAVAETGGFTKAAQRCLVVQSALSHQIARLERELGARLFDRTSRSVRLTAAGAAFLPSARQCLDFAERAAAEVAAAVGEVRGRVVVGVIPTVAAVDLPAALKVFRERYPQVRVALRMAPSHELVEQVRHGGLDLAFLGLAPNVRPEGVRGHELARDEHVAVVAPSHPLAGHAETTLQELAEELFVDFPAGSPGRVQADQAFAAAGLQREVAFEVTTAELMAGLIREGLGVAVLPSRYTPRLSGVVTLPITNGPSRVEHLVWNAAGLTPAAAAFLDVLGVSAGGTGGEHASVDAHGLAGDPRSAV